MTPLQDNNAASRRDPTGSIAFDAYRAEATAQRGQMMRDAHALRMVTSGALVLAGVLGFAVVLSASTGSQSIP